MDKIRIYNQSTKERRDFFFLLATILLCHGCQLLYALIECS